MKKAYWLTLIILFSFSTVAQAKNAKEVFAIASKTVVVVKVYDEKLNLKATGSGVVVGNGEVVTNCHVVKEGAYYFVGYDKTGGMGTLLYADTSRDLCMLVSPEVKASAVQIDSAAKLKVGMPVYAIGAPQGLELSLSDGLVAQLRGEKTVQLCI